MGLDNRVGVLVSGNGTTLEAARKAELANGMKASIAFVVCNNPPDKAGAWQRASRLGLADDMYLVNNVKFSDDVEPPKGAITKAASMEILRLAREVYGVKMLVTLGFMKRLILPVLGGLPIANLHPGPLPATANTYGEGASIRAIELGLTHAGPTFHFMSTKTGEDGLPPYDEGQIIWHEPVRITAKHRQEFKTTGHAKLLFSDVQKTEKAGIGQWIDLAVINL